MASRFLAGALWLGAAVGAQAQSVAAGAPERGWSDSAPAPAMRVRLGTIGDSYTDEYTGYPFGYARSWTQVLAERGVDVGPTAAIAGVRSWGEPRGTGMQSNWALAGARAWHAAEVQAPGLVRDQRASAVTHAVVFVGINDWSSWTTDDRVGWLYFGVLQSTLSRDALRQYVDDQARAHESIILSLERAGIPAMLCTVPDLRICPHTHAAFGAWGADAWRGAMRPMNDRILAIARTHNTPVLDLHALFEALFGQPESPRQTLIIGGETIHLRERMDASGGLAQNAWSHDGVHPGTVIQGVIANAVCHGLNRAYGLSLPVMNDQEILTAAALPGQNGPNTLEQQIGPLVQFVRLPIDLTCQVDWNHNGGADLGDLMTFLGAWFGGQSEADVNASGGLDVGDVLTYLERWFMGC